MFDGLIDGYTQSILIFTGISVTATPRMNSWVELTVIGPTW